MNDNQLNSKIVQEDIELTEENKIESVYNNDRETNNKISDINQEENNYIDEQNLSSKNDVLNNEEKEENGLNQNKDSHNNVINGENPEEIQPQEDRNNLANDIQQNEDYLNENNTPSSTPSLVCVTAPRPSLTTIPWWCTCFPTVPSSAVMSWTSCVRYRWNTIRWPRLQ